MAIRVMIYADTLKRDALTMSALALLLKEQGYETVVCSRSTYALYYDAFKPDIVVQSHAFMGGNTPEVLAERSKKTKFIILFTEAASIFKYGFFVKVVERECLLPDNYKPASGKYAKYITRALTWGNRTRQWLLEEGIFKPEAVRVVGNPRFDEYRGMKGNIEKEGVGFVGRFAGFNTFDQRGMFCSIDRERHDHGIRYARDRNVEDPAWYAIATARVFFDLLDKVILEHKMGVLYRPHPNERLKGYEYHTKKYGANFKLDDSISFSEWLLKTKAIVMNASTCMTEGFVNGIPVISILGLIGDRLDDHMHPSLGQDTHLPFLKFCYIPKTTDECIDMIDKADKGLLKPVAFNDELRKLLYDFCDWPRKEPSLVTIAREIKEVAEIVKTEKKARRTINAGISISAPVKLSLGFLRKFLVYLRSPVSLELDRHYNYLFWHRKKYAKSARRIVDNLGKDI